MKIDVEKNAKEEYKLFINDELILEDRMLSKIVKKIEQYLKMRFLPDTEKRGLAKIGEFFQ